VTAKLEENSISKQDQGLSDSHYEIGQTSLSLKIPQLVVKDPNDLKNFLKGGLIFYFSFDEILFRDDKLTTSDDSGNQYDGELLDSNSINSDGITPPQLVNNCISGRCLYFDGNDDFVKIVRGEDINNSQFTVLGWIKPTKSAYPRWISKGDGYTLSIKGWSIEIYNNNDTLFRWTEGTNRPYMFVPINSLNNWTFTVVIFKYPQVKGYKDGNEIASSTTNIAPSISNQTFAIGGLSGGYMGFIDDVRFYSRILTPLEIQALYLAAKGLKNY